MNSKEKENIENQTSKKVYSPPEIITEELMSFGALCNGTASGGRKEAIGAPSFCNSNKLNS